MLWAVSGYLTYWSTIDIEGQRPMPHVQMNSNDGALPELSRIRFLQLLMLYDSSVGQPPGIVTLTYHAAETMATLVQVKVGCTNTNHLKQIFNALYKFTHLLCCKRFLQIVQWQWMPIVCYDMYSYLARLKE